MKFAVLFAALLFAHVAAHADPTLDRLRAAGRLKCGVITEPLDWNKTDLHGSLARLDSEICRAVAAAVFGAPSQVDVLTYNVEEDGLAAVHAGKIDLAVGVTPGALAADHWSVRFSLPFFQDAQGFMVHRAEGIHTLADIAGHKLCFIDDTENEPIAFAVLLHRGIRPVPFGFQEEGEMDAAIMDRHCQVTTALLSKLAEARESFRNAQDYVLLPDALTLVPVSAAVAADDAKLSAIVDYTLTALWQAEFLGVTRANVTSSSHSEDPRIARLLGDDYASAVGLGLPHDWSRRVIAAVGNYGEIYDRSIGPGTSYNLARGVNGLWNRGGVMAPLPLR
jgi:general L-amino acid transport system substrate-binding protein